MLRLRQTFGVHAGRILGFDQPVIRIGRLPGSDVAFDPKGDLDASGRHAEIRQNGEEYILVDVGSRNGTLVNGQPIQEVRLSHGDEIEFGVGGPRATVEMVENPGDPEAAATHGLHTEDELSGAYDVDAPTIAIDRSHKEALPSEPPRSEAPSRTQTSSKAWLWLLVVVIVVGLGAWFVFQARHGSNRTSVDVQGGVSVANVGAMSAEEIKLQFQRALYALVEQPSEGQERAVCTAFAVRPDLLATAAHCLVAIEKAAQRGSKFQATSCDEKNGIQAAIVRMWRHPGFMLDGIEPSADVGIVQIDRGVLDQVALAGVQHLDSLSKHERLWLFGMTGETVRQSCYGAQVYAASAQRVYQSPTKDHMPLELIEYATVLPSSAGGSPVFNTSGLVVGVHSATLGALVTGIRGDDRLSQGYTYGIRADALLQLLAGLEDANE